MVKVHHVSDLHIRAGCNIKARYSEYSFVFSRFIEHVRNDKQDSIVVITGDIFHHKSRIESPGIKLFYDFIKALGELLPVYVIRGNHDYKQWDDAEVDLIGSLLIPGIQGVRYIDQTGVVTCPKTGIAIGVLAIQDVLKSGNANASIKVDVMPDFPRPAAAAQHKIALFHGTVPSTISAVSEMFKGYDVAMLGDNHLQQVMGTGLNVGVAAANASNASNASNANSNIIALDCKHIAGFTYGYAGSMIRQGQGEPQKGHGFLTWDLDKKTVTMFHIVNPVEIAAEEAEGDAEVLSKPNLRDQFHNNDSDEDNDNDTIQDDTPNNSVKHWTDYLLKNGGDASMVCFLKQPELLILPKTCIECNDANELLCAKAKERQAKIVKKLEAYSDSSTAGKENKPGRGVFRLVLARWDWVLCYGPGNMFNFGKLDGNINILAARNGHGKTSFLEMILLGLYGTGFPSRTNKSRSASIISLSKPNKAACQVALTIMMDKSLVRITRHFNRQEDAKKLHSVSKTTTIEIRAEDGYGDKGDGWTGWLSGKTAVDKWVNANVGPMSTFLLSCMVSQNADNDFFNLSPAEQKELLDNAINVETHTRYMDLVKESRLAHIAMSDLVGSTISTLNKMVGEFPVSDGEARLAQLNACIKGNDGDDCNECLAPPLPFVSKLEPREYYETIVKGSEAIQAIQSIQDMQYELETLKRSRSQASSMLGLEPKHKLEWYKKEWDKLAAFSLPSLPSQSVLYDKTVYKKTKEAYDTLLASGANLDHGCGYDVGPYKAGCECCESRQKARELREISDAFATQYNAKKTYLKGCIAILCTNQIDELELKIKTAQRVENAAKILASYDALVMQRDMTALLLEKQRIETQLSSKKRILLELEIWTRMKSMLDVRVAAFGSIFKIMDGFIAWLYAESILPRIAQCTSQIMALIDPELSMEAGINDEGFEWSMRANSIHHPIEKASGFQRFLCGLAIRIALGGIGATGVKPRQLFLDEGFTSCDQTNLSKVPDMLRTLLQLYDGIVLVTHLEDLKESGDATISITRTTGNLSKLVW